MINSINKIAILLSLTVLVSLGSTINSESQVNQPVPIANNCNVYNGYLSGEMDAWLKGIAEQEDKYKRSGTSDDLYALILSKYGFIGFVIGMKKEYDVRDIISSAEADVAVLAQDEKYSAQASAMEGGLIAMRISLNPLKAAYLGMKSLRLIEESLEADRNNPAGWVEMGNARFHMPSIAGGSYKEAISNFSQAVTIFEKEKEGLKCNWYYLHTLVWLARSYENTGDFAEAKKLYEKLLSMEPEFLWVKQELYPGLLKKTGS